MQCSWVQRGRLWLLGMRSLGMGLESSSTEMPRQANAHYQWLIHLTLLEPFQAATSKASLSTMFLATFRLATRSARLTWVDSTSPISQKCTKSLTLHPRTAPISSGQTSSTKFAKVSQVFRALSTWSRGVGSKLTPKVPLSLPNSYCKTKRQTSLRSSRKERMTSTSKSTRRTSLKKEVNWSRRCSMPCRSTRVWLPRRLAESSSTSTQLLQMNSWSSSQSLKPNIRVKHSRCFLTWFWQSLRREKTKSKWKTTVVRLRASFLVSKRDFPSRKRCTNTGLESGTSTRAS